MIKMCIDLRNSYFKNLNDVEFVLEYNKKVTLENITDIAFDKEKYEQAIETAKLNNELELIL